MSPTEASDYRLAPLVVARFVGLYLVLLALLMFVATAIVAAADVRADVLLVVLAVGVVGLFVLAWLLRSRVAVVHLDATGYRVALVRGAGVKEAPWAEVEEAVTASPRGIPCVVLRLRDGRRTTIPVQVLQGEPDDLARDVQARLRGQ